MGRSVVVRARGHREIRATHGKTLELTRETGISARATCVVGVAAELEPGEVGLLRGRVTVTVEAAGRSATGSAVVNPGHDVRDRLVIRRSRWSDVDTLAVGSTLTADDLDPGLAAALTDPDTVVTLTVTEAGPVPPLVLLVAADGAAPGGRLGRFAAAARSTVDLCRLGRGRLPLGDLEPGATVVARLPARSSAGSPELAAWFAAAAERGARFAATDLVWPLPALAAAGLPPAPAVWSGHVGKRELRDPAVADLLAAPPVPVACEVPVGEAAAVLARVAGADPAHRVAVGDDALDVGIAVEWLAAGDAAASIAGRTAETVPVVVPSRPGGARRLEVDAVLRALAAAGVAPRTLSEALAPLGISRRQIYDTTSSSVGKRETS